MAKIDPTRIQDKVFFGANVLDDYYSIAFVEDLRESLVKDAPFPEGGATTDDILNRLSYIYNTDYIRPDFRASLPSKETVIPILADEVPSWGGTLQIKGGVIETFTYAEFVELDIDRAEGLAVSMPDLMSHFGMVDGRRVHFTLFNAVLDKSSGHIGGSDLSFSICAVIEFTLEVDELPAGKANDSKKTMFSMPEYAGFKAMKKVRIEYGMGTKTLEYTRDDNLMAASTWDRTRMDIFEDRFSATLPVTLYKTHAYSGNRYNVNFGGNGFIGGMTTQKKYTANYDRFSVLADEMTKKVNATHIDIEMPPVLERREMSMGVLAPSVHMPPTTIAIPLPDYKSKGPRRTEFGSTTGRLTRTLKMKLASKDEMFYVFPSGHSLQTTTTIYIMTKSGGTRMIPRVQYTSTWPIMSNGKIQGGDIKAARLVSLNIKLDAKLTGRLADGATYDFVEINKPGSTIFKTTPMTNITSSLTGPITSAIHYKSRRDVSKESYNKAYIWWRHGNVIAAPYIRRVVEKSPMTVSWPDLDYDKVIAAGGADNSPFFDYRPLDGLDLDPSIVKMLDPLNMYCTVIRQTHEGTMVLNTDVIRDIDISFGGYTHLNKTSAATLARARLYRPSSINKLARCITSVNLTPHGDDPKAPSSGMTLDGSSKVHANINVTDMTLQKVGGTDIGYHIEEVHTTTNVVRSGIGSHNIIIS